MINKRPLLVLISLIITPLMAHAYDAYLSIHYINNSPSPIILNNSAAGNKVSYTCPAQGLCWPGQYTLEAYNGELDFDGQQIDLSPVGDTDAGAHTQLNNSQSSYLEISNSGILSPSVSFNTNKGNFDLSTFNSNYYSTKIIFSNTPDNSALSASVYSCDSNWSNCVFSGVINYNYI